MARQFGATWWGKAWLDALEDRAILDPNRLGRGRTYARQGRVRHVELEPGLLRAEVLGTDRYYAQIGVRVLSDDRWDALFDLIMERAAHVAALLSGEVPEAMAPMLLPDEGDLGPDCSCPDAADPCKHAAALCYIAADLFDEDPFALLLLRGRGRDEVLSEVRRRRAGALGAAPAEGLDLPRGSDPGIGATAAWRRSAEPFRGSLPTPRVSGTLLDLAARPPADAGIDVAELRELVEDAASRAHAMLRGDGDSGLGLSVGADVVRRVAVSGQVERVAEATRLKPDELAVAARAWRIGEEPGLRVSRDRWEPEESAMALGRRWLGDDARVRANTVSHDGVQLRLDRTDQWWRFEFNDEFGWVLISGPAEDPGDLLA